MKFISPLKWRLKQMVERHPYTYWVTKKLLTRIPFFLPHEEDFYGFRHLIKEEVGLFLDIGANDGISCRSFRKFKTDWQILSIEANPLHEAELQRLKKKFHNFDFRIAAVGRTSGERLTLYTPVYRSIPIHSAASLSREYAEKTVAATLPCVSDPRRFVYKETVTPTLRVDDLSILPQLVKMDIEGSELNSLFGMEKTIERARPFFLVEVNRDHFSEVKDFFIKKAYLPFGYNSKKDGFEPFQENLFRGAFFFPSEKCGDLPIFTKDA